MNTTLYNVYSIDYMLYIMYHSLVSVCEQKRRIKVCESLDLESPETSYSDILQRLVRRYLFKLERQKDEGSLYTLLIL